MKNISDYYGSNTFNDQAMQKYLPKDIHKKLKDTIEERMPLDKDIASIVAHGMKEWALNMGATHYTHWFQPLRGITAEKHTSFIQKNDLYSVIERLSKDELIQGETDASSFPSGGVRTTFEARGYTIWDPTSPAFIIDDTLCIPCIFITYNGEPLDRKMPLLRSIEKVTSEALRILKLFGNRTAKYVDVTLGAEQEYFLVDRNLLEKRIDLKFVGRTLFGNNVSKGHLFEDHYFGSINEKVLAFMRDFEQQLYKLGIPVKTRHNEVAPHQFEFAPIFEHANIAADHNALSMEIMKKTAGKYNLEVLFHEKPFAGINGSGKHCNWSLADSDGNNLLLPGNSEKKRLQFLTFLVAIMIGIHRFEKLLKLSVINYTNEFRLGGNEAPPAILSIFVGNEISDLLDKISSLEDIMDFDEKKLKTDLPRIPELTIDYTDRNRTSPFAFTGNKFEFRMPGSLISVAEVCTALNSVIYYGLKEMADAMEIEIKKTNDYETAALRCIQKAYKKIKSIVYNSDCYTKEWHEEAKKRGLSITSNLYGILEEINPADFSLCFLKPQIFSQSYLNAIIGIKKSQYIDLFKLEVNTLLTILLKDIIPVISNEMQSNENANLILSNFGLKNYSNHISVIKNLFDKLCKSTGEFSAICKQVNDCSISCSVELLSSVKHCMNEIRTLIDSIEPLIDRKKWPFPCYDELLSSI